MSNTEHTTAHAVTPGDDRHLTVEDTGSTTDAADLVGDDAHRDTATTDSSGTDAAATGAGSTASGSGTERGGLGGLPDDGLIGHVFDQTNGVIEGAEGDSDGTADGELYSPAERGAGNSALDGSEPLGGDENA
jgi:hypothetical protein